MIDDVIEPFKLPALERISKIVGDHFTGFEITGLFKKSGFPEIVHDGSTKWRFLCSTFENLQKRKFGPYIILKFLETACDPQEYFEKPESHIAILHKLNDVLSFYGMKINDKGKVIKIKEKRDTVAMTLKNVPESSTKSISNRNPHKKRDFTILAIIISVVAAFVFSPYFSDFISPPIPEIHVTDLNALDGIVEGNSPTYSYEPRTLIPNGTKSETFFLTISNSGGAHAKNFWIDIYEKPDGQWFDFHTSAVVYSGITKNCQNKSSLCTIELIPKETGSIELQYGVSFDHKLYQEIADETPKLFFKYGFDDHEEQVIEIFLKFDLNQ